MKFSGFYMTNGKGKEGAKENTINMFKNELSDTITKLYGENLFEVIDIIRESEDESYDDQTGECYDVHFILNLLEVNGIKEDTKDFYFLEEVMCTGLGVVDEDLLLD